MYGYEAWAVLLTVGVMFLGTKAIFCVLCTLNMIFTGSVEVMVGKEGLQFVTGPFSYYGAQALSKNY